MGKKLISSVLAMIILLTAAGCASILEGETTEITPYYQAGDSAISDTAIEVSTYDGFRQEVFNMVQNHTESAIFRITTFDREDLEGSLNEICQDITSSDPLGSYATYYISCHITPIVGYKDVTVNIVYKKDLSEITNISTVSTDRYLQILLESALTEYSPSCTFYTSLPSITADYIKEYIHSRYYSDPLNVVILPDITVTSYPETDGMRIVEVSLNFNNYTENVLESMNNDLDSEIQDIIGALPDADDFNLLSAVYEHMTNSYRYTKTSSTKLSSTAYNVIVNNSGDDEGFAMAFKALCDKLLIKCTVVSGKYMGEDHFWNIVTFGGESYHVDVTTYFTEEVPAFMRGDEYMRENYWWDNSTVPQCPADYEPIAEIPDTQNNAEDN